MIGLVSTLVLAAHLIAVDLAMVAPLACIWLAWRARCLDDPLAAAAERRLALESLAALALGIALGAVQLGLLWLRPERDFFSAARRLPADRLWFSLAELVFYFVCMGGYVALRRGNRHWRLAALLAVLAATNLMYHFPPLFSMLGLLANRPELVDQQLTSRLFRTLLLDPEVVAMVAHVWLAAVAVTGVAVMRLVAGSGGEPVPAAQNLAARAARFALAATLLELPVGLWVLLTVPAESRDALIGVDTFGTLLFALAIVAVLGLMHHLAAVAQGDAARSQIRRSVMLILTVVLLMTAALERSRNVPRIARAQGQNSESIRELPGTVPILRSPRSKMGLSPSPRQFSDRLSLAAAGARPAEAP